MTAHQGYQHQPAFDRGRLPVGQIHELHYEQYGNPQGKPALYVHGGPGGSTSFEHTAFFDPKIYRVVLFDQRGAGQSTPSAELRENTSPHLVLDIEALRKHLNISKWHLVYGGSWGSALSLMYTQAHPAMVGSLIISGVSTGRKKEFGFSRGPAGAAMLFPEAYASFLEPLPSEDRSNPILGYSKLLKSPDAHVRLAAARSFSRWDLTICGPGVTKERWAKLDDEKWCIEHSTLETHYFSHGIFIEEGQLLRKEEIDKIRHIPCTIIQGRYDTITAPQTAWELHEQWPESTLHMVPGEGHVASEPGKFKQITKACDAYAQL